MTSQLSHAERTEALLENPERYGELVEEYEDGVEFYKKTRPKAPKVANGFEDYLSYYSIFIEQGPSGYIYSDLKRNTDRSIKNMITGGSDAGETFRIYTLNEAVQRVNAYQELGIQDTSIRGVVTTLLEELYEENSHRKSIYPVLSTLLDCVPNSERDVVKLVARARLVAGLDTVYDEQQILEELRRYLDVTTDPRPEDDRSAEEILDETNNRSFGDPELVDLYEAALHRNPSIELLSEYLYFTGRDIVERCRHRDREDPTVGELHLSERQFRLIQQFPIERESEDAAYLQSYLYLARGLYESGREWHSGQDPRRTRESNFAKAAQEYLRAAAAIKEWNSERYIKYLNKAFRHAANATDSWQGKIEVHDCAVVALIEAGQDIDTSSAIDSISESKQLQQFWGQVAESYTHLEQGDPEKAHDSAITAEEHLREIDIKPSSYMLQRALALSEGLILEEDDDYQSAISRYSELETDDEMVRARENIAYIKLCIQDGESEEALECALSEFGDDSLITNAVRAVSNNEISSLRSHGTISDDLFTCDIESIECRLQSLLLLYVGTDDFSDFFRSHVQLALMEL